MADGPTDPRVIEQTLRKGELEIRKLASEAELAEVKAVVPTIPDLPTGKVDAGDKPSPVSSLGVFKALDVVAGQVAARCAGRSLEKVRVVPDDVTAIERQAHELVTAVIVRAGEELADVDRLLADSTEPSDLRGLVGPGAVVAASVFSALAPAVASLLETNTTIRSATVDLTFASAAAALAGSLRASDIEVVVGTVGLPTSGQLTRQIRELERRRLASEVELALFDAAKPSSDERAAARREGLEIVLAAKAKDADREELAKILDEIDEESNKIASGSAAIVEHDRRAARAREILDSLAKLLSALEIVAADRSVLGLAEAYSESKQFASLIVSSTFGAGESIYEEIPVKKDRGLHVGTAAVSFLLVDPSGALVDAGVLTAQAAATTTMGEPKVEWADPR